MKTVHYLQNVAPKPEKTEPRMIPRLVEVLYSRTKPANLTGDTMDFIRGNAKNWGFNTLTMLEKHYETSLEVQMQDLKKDFVPNWKPAFEVATRWAYRNLPRMPSAVVDHVEALIASTAHDDVQEVRTMQEQRTCTTQVDPPTQRSEKNSAASGRKKTGTRAVATMTEHTIQEDGSEIQLFPEEITLPEEKGRWNRRQKEEDRDEVII